MKDVRTITVLGAGDMGHGVAELAALNGFTVRLRDIDGGVVETAMKKVEWSLGKLADHETITREQADAAFARITGTTDLAEAVDATDLVIEAVPESLELKQRVFAEVEAAAPADAVFASNTSTIRISEIGAKLNDPSRLVGMHFFNPVLLMDLVEVIPGDASSKEAVDAVVGAAKRFNKTTVVLKKDTPGFVTSRLIGVWVGAGVLAHEHGVAAKEEIDAAMKFGAGFPMGPFELADYTGIDIGYHASQYIASRLGPAYAASKALEEKVQAGELGKKTGHGFYEWDGNRVKARVSPDQAKGFDPALIMSVVANEAAKLLDEGVATAADIDLAMRNGTAFPKGPLEWADAHGLDKVLETLEGVKAKTGAALAEPAPGLKGLVDAGKLGKKTGAGFYAHEEDASASSAAADAGAPEFETVLVDVDADARVGTITLNRPHRLHAISPELVRDMEDAFRLLERDERVRCIVITGTGDKAFSVGADLMAAMGDGDITPNRAMDVARDLHLVLERFEQSAKPVVAAINGYAFGGGLEIALACDFRVAAKRAKVGLPELTLGLLPAGGGTQRLPKLIGLARAKEFIFFGERWSAEDAQAIGVLHRVFENDAFEDDVKAYATRLARGAPLAQKFAKRALNQAMTVPISEGKEIEAAAFGILATTEDAMEGVAAMFQKRPPEFQGR